MGRYDEWTVNDLSGERYLDSRDIEECIDGWRDTVNALTEKRDEEPEAFTAEDAEALADATAALDDLNNAVGEVRGYGDWRYGETLIREDAFEDYAYDLACDLYGCEAVSDGLGAYVDWERWAADVAMDYMTVTIGGSDYLMRG